MNTTKKSKVYIGDPLHPYAQTEEEKARKRAQYHANPEYYLKYCREWREKNPNYVKDYYSTHHKVSVTNKNRNSKMWNAQSIAAKIPIQHLCELCPQDDIRLAVLRHHPDYDFVSL
jgi:hypothetical protein